ncbi:hypothetical protein ALC57_11794 [Trachymyrmex cornetzi]|uniref:Integrase catalytic domain-containing protein n=1 Tax=Trachymyrmex cornetzi TaxID=471704 RepID=A0A151J1Z8_9HYME|nr:hypothetical protein ALC57_11794 [Trachymyrmex cornetzi]
MSKGLSGSAQVRATLDFCSQSSFVSNRLCDELGLKKIPVNHYLDTLNCKGSIIKHTYSVTLSSLHCDFEFQINCLVLDEIEQQMPAEPIELQYLNFPKHLPLADSSFHIPGRVDLLIGGEWFWRLLCIGQIEINKQGLVLQKTKLGRIVDGPTFSQVSKSIKCNFNDVKSSSNIDAIKKIRLISLEKRFLKDKTFKANYCAFMREYEELGHMTNVKETSHDYSTFYMPHHGVLRPASASTKLRMVFDGSLKSDSGLSLNDCQYVGPVVQKKFFSILIRFRQYPYVVYADIQKMYRQILVSLSDRPLQRILWRTDPKEEIKIYELNTLTYGTSSASYLAIRSLMQLSVNNPGRGSRTSKCYICLFICLSTKAIHLEIVSDLSTDSFLAAIRRFIACRGKPQHLYSDNGTTFVGANNKLIELGKFLHDELDILNLKTDEIGVCWHFVPAYSSHMGGLWEAGVRSTKHHLRRVASNASLTFEEKYTLAAQIEAILNSRPLTSNDSNDYTPLTPAHFLIGRKYTSTADPSLNGIKESRLSRWQLIQQIQQHFWTRWHKEYTGCLKIIG